MRAQTGVAQIRHAPSINGAIEGSVQMMSGENMALNGNSLITADLLVPGVPTVRLNGRPVFSGVLEGEGAAAPSNYQITLNGSARLRNLIRRTDAVALPVVSPPTAPTGTRTVSLNAPAGVIGSFSTLRNLTLNSNVGRITVPPGAYGDFTANNGSGFAMGVAGATQPAVYHFQRITLNSSLGLQILGPVIVTVGNTLTVNSSNIAADVPSWLSLNVSSGGLTLNGNSLVSGYVTAPGGTVTINGNSSLTGGLISDRLTVNGNGVLRLLARGIANQAPEVALTSPVYGATFTAPATVTLSAAATDADGVIAKVEFFQGTTKLGEATSSPYQFSWTGVATGTYALSAKATDNAGASATSASVTVTVEAPVPQAPVVALTSPDDGGSFNAPATVGLSATASAFGGSIAKVEFYREGAVPVKLGESIDAPFGFTWSAVPPGTYTLTAKAYDTNGLTAISAARTVTVRMTVPYFTGFDPADGYTVGPLGGQVAWTATTGEATISDTSGHQGGQAIQLTAQESAVQASHDFSVYNGHTVVFADFFAKPVAGAVADSAVFVQADVAHVALVRSGMEGELYVLNGSGEGSGVWVATGFKIPLTAGGQPVDWLRVTLREDFAAKKWDLYAGGKLIAYDLGFTDGTKTLFTRIAFIGQPAGTSVFDDLYVGFEHPLFANQSKDGIDDGWKTGYGLDTTANIRNENPDHDAWTNIREYLLGTSPLSADTDGDLIPDEWELAHGLNPLSSADAAISKSGDGWTALMKYLRGRDPGEDERSTNARLVAGGDQGLWVNAAGLAHVWGRNSGGQLGSGDTVDRVRMEALAGLGLPVVAAAWGDAHGLAITQDCLVHTWGGNYFGQLGDGTHVSRRTPVTVGGLGSIVRVAAGDHHSLALRGDGTVWAWGGNQRGQLGGGSTTSSRVPLLVPGLSRIVEIAAGASHSVALDTEGRVWVWGSNDFGQVGDATVSERLTPQVLTGLAPFKKIASGRHHVLALERTGGVRAWGANQAGQLGIGSHIGQVSPGAVSLPGNISGIAAGDGFSLALEEGGFVWSWGSNDLGQLGDDSAAFNDPLPAVLGLELISGIAAGKDHAVVLRDDGTLLSWGFNQHGQLGAPSAELFIRAPQPVTPPAN